MATICLVYTGSACHVMLDGVPSVIASCLGLACVRTTGRVNNLPSQAESIINLACLIISLDPNCAVVCTSMNGTSYCKLRTRGKESGHGRNPRVVLSYVKQCHRLMALVRILRVVTWETWVSGADSPRPSVPRIAQQGMFSSENQGSAHRVRHLGDSDNWPALTPEYDKIMEYLHQATSHAHSFLALYLRRGELTQRS
jgi:hypothetical protein